MKGAGKKRAPAPEPAEPRPASPLATQVSASVGIVAAMVLAMLLNVFVARHYRRWDWTRGGLYTLSEATVATLHGLPETVKIYVLLPGGDGLTLSVEHLLESYLGPGALNRQLCAIRELRIHITE